MIDCVQAILSDGRGYRLGRLHDYGQARLHRERHRRYHRRRDLSTSSSRAMTSTRAGVNRSSHRRNGASISAAICAEATTVDRSYQEVLRALREPGPHEPNQDWWFLRGRGRRFARNGCSIGVQGAIVPAAAGRRQVLGTARPLEGPAGNGTKRRLCTLQTRWSLALLLFVRLIDLQRRVVRSTTPLFC